MLHRPRADRHPRRAIVVGSGPNGLTSAALLAKAGWQVDVYERNAVPGGAAASHDGLGQGTIVDLGAAGHPFGVASPVFQELDLTAHGLQWAHSRVPMAHPLPHGEAAVLHRDLDTTAQGLGPDAGRWRAIHGHLVDNIDEHLQNLLAPMLRMPAHPLRLARFAPVALAPAARLTDTMFATEAARALFLGSAAHAIAPLAQPFTGAFGALFGALGMTRGWPVVRGGTGQLIAALVSVLQTYGGRLHLNHEVTNLAELPYADAVILNLTPAQALRVTDQPVSQATDQPASPGAASLAPATRRRLGSWRYGTAAYKVDFLLNGPIPWTNPEVACAGTVHVVGDSRELLQASAEVAAGLLPNRPFVMVCQQQAADPTRATGPAQGATVIWAYAHVPHGYQEREPGEISRAITQQIERFAPGFQALIRHQVTTSPAQLEAWNPNLLGGDIAGGAMTGLQALLRPGLTLDPHRLHTSIFRRKGSPRLYLASSSTPPGAGVHGMPGLWAARAVARDFRN